MKFIMLKENISKRLTLLLYMLCALFTWSASVASQLIVPTVEDLSELKRQAEASKLPILLLFSAEDCDYCEVVRENYLLPMMRSGDYVKRILFRQIYIEDYSYLRDINGEQISADTIALKYDVELTPTILFIDSNGNELSHRVVGVSNRFYFGETLDKHIAQALTSLAEKLTTKPH